MRLIEPSLDPLIRVEPTKPLADHAVGIFFTPHHNSISANSQFHRQSSTLAQASRPMTIAAIAANNVLYRLGNHFDIICYPKWLFKLRLFIFDILGQRDVRRPTSDQFLESLARP